MKDLCHNIRNATVALHLHVKKLPKLERARADKELIRIEIALRDYVERTVNVPTEKPSGS